MDRRVVVLACAALLSGAWFAATPAFADDQDEAEQSASTFVQRLTDGELSQIYGDLTTSQFRSTIPQERFEQTVGVLRIQLGGARGKPVVIGSQRLSQDPTGRPGDFYYVRCRANYVPGPLFWDIWLQKSAGRWAVNGFFYLPAQQP